MRHGEASDRTDRLWEAVHSRSRQPKQAYRRIRSNRVREDGPLRIDNGGGLTCQFYYQIFDQGKSGILSPRWLISYHRGPLEPLEIKRLKEGAAPEKMTVRAVPLSVPEEVFLRDTDRKRAKKGILGGTEEKVAFDKKIFLPYLDF